MKVNDIIAAIDIGTSKIVAVLVNVDGKGNKTILTVKELPSSGVKKGGIVNISMLEAAIDYAIEMLEEECGVRIHSIVTSISGTNIMGYNVEGKVDIRSQQVTKRNIIQSIVTARDGMIPDNRRVLQTFQQNFIIDGQTEIDDPIGLIGDELLSQFHIISAAESACKNIEHIFTNKSIEVENIVAAGYASSIAVLTEKDKKLGVCVLDIGAGTTEIVIYSNGSIRHTEVIPVGGDLITKDLAFYMKSTIDGAEEIKKTIRIDKAYGFSEQASINVVGGGTQRHFFKNELASVVQERVEQLLGFIMSKINRAGYEDVFPSGFVICGGSANLSGIIEFIAEKTHMPVRIGKPLVNQQDRLNDPKYATIVGLFDCAYFVDYSEDLNGVKKDGVVKLLGSLKKTIRSMF